jgi:4'-phosphopantetheinyl transferase EntD
MPLLARILEPDLFGVEMEDAGQPVFLPLLEEALVEKAAPKRRREFALGRACAREALEKLGHREVVIGRSASGAPLWPQGITGSITHTNGYAAAMVCAARHFFGIGLDAERVGGVTPDFWPRLFDAHERHHLISLNDAEQMVTATVIFSAKEACYKAWGCAGTLEFRKIRITPERDGFTAVRSGQELHGRYAVDGDLVLTAAWLYRR